MSTHTVANIFEFQWLYLKSSLECAKPDGVSCPVLSLCLPLCWEDAGASHTISEVTVHFNCITGAPTIGVNPVVVCRKQGEKGERERRQRAEERRRKGHGERRGEKGRRGKGKR